MQTHTSSEKCDKETRDCLTMNHKLKHLIRYTQFFSIYLTRYFMKLELQLVALAMLSTFNESNAKHEHFTLSWESIIHHTSSIRHLNSHSSLCFLLLLSSSSISISSHLIFFAIVTFTLHLLSLTRSHFLLYVIYYSFFTPSFSPSFFLSWQWQGWSVERRVL